MKANDIRAGHAIKYNNDIYIVLKTAHTQPGKGGAYIQTEMKQIHGKTKLNVRFRSSEDVEKAHIESKECQFLYAEDDVIYLMDIDTYDQLTANIDTLQMQLRPFLEEGMMLNLQIHENIIISINMKERLEAKITKCDPHIKGQTVTSSYKSATLENGAKIMVPPFIEVGDKIAIKSQTLEYIERI
ncbi:MAG: elongation factor P [Proteobacteria bacterium]|nr:elongation factor P [Pseudomonadota bacterium]